MTFTKKNAHFSKLKIFFICCIRLRIFCFKKLPGGITIVSWVSIHGRNFGPHGCLPGIKISSVYIEAVTVAPEMWYMDVFLGVGTCPGHYGSGKCIPLQAGPLDCWDPPPFQWNPVNVRCKLISNTDLGNSGQIAKSDTMTFFWKGGGVHSEMYVCQYYYFLTF